MAQSVWVWEKQAMKGEPMPKGLRLDEQAAYQAMRGLYAAYSLGRITKEQAATEKQAIVTDYTERHRELDAAVELFQRQMQLWTEMQRFLADTLPELAGGPTEGGRR